VNLKKRLFSVAAASALATGALVAAGAGAAQAAPSLGTLTITPTSGVENTGLTGELSASCPANSTGQNGFISGPGITGEAVLDSNRPPATTFSFSNTLLDVFQGAGIAAPNGTYTVRIACIGADFFTETGEFTQQLTVTPRTGSGSTANYVTVVPAQGTSVTLAQNAASGSFGDSVTFTADATDGVPGSVQFKDGASNLGSPQSVNATGVASFTTTTLAVGSHAVTAVFTPTDTAAHSGSTSNQVTHVVNTIATSLSLTSNDPSNQFAPANFTATVTPAAAGTVTFTVDGSPASPVTVDGSGVATYSTPSLAVGAHTVTAHFTPGATSGADPSDAGPITHNVAAFAGVSLTENVTVTVPTGTLSIALEGTEDGNVDLGTAVMDPSGDFLTASGAIDPVKIIDTRAGDPGWVASGIVTNFVKGSDEISGFNLGWTPFVNVGAGGLSANQAGAFVIGSPVVAGNEATPSSTPSDPAAGLKASRTFGTAPDNSGNGTAHLGADLDLNIPTDVPAGTYAAVLTLTVV
jgi:hypothetical protein